MEGPMQWRQSEESGFTLVEVMIAAIILVTGLLSLAYAFGLGLGSIDTAQMDSIARQKARQAMEDVFTARDTGGVTFSQICNLPTTGCLFNAATTSTGATNYLPLYTPGPDGLVFTADDGEAAPVPGVTTHGAATGNVLPTGCSAAPCIETVETPGPDGILGTGDDVYVPLDGYFRNITITPVPGTSNLNQVTVSIMYTTPNGITRYVTIIAYIGPYV